MNIFDLLYDNFKFDKNKPLKLFEGFAGIGTQRMALERLGIELDVVGISDWFIPVNITYNAIHRNNKNNVIERERDENYIIDYLMTLGLSANDKEPVERAYYERKNIKWLNKLYKVIKENKNYGAIGTFDSLPNDLDIATWSFPCQDISQAGQQKGMEKGTKSNYGYEFLDIVERTKRKPKVLLMENVRALLSKPFEEDWREIQLRLEKMGYTNYAEILNAKDYGVAQNRERVFIVSILGEYTYNFPKSFKLNKMLKDYLEKEVDEKYYLSDKMIRTLSGVDYEGDFDRASTFKPHYAHESEYAYTITTRAGNRSTDNFIIKDNRNLKEKLADTLIENKIVKGGEIINHSYARNRLNDERIRIESDDGIMPTLTTRPDTLGYVEPNLRIRKLTPKECWLLMGIDENKFDKARKVTSNAQLYKQAGNAIVVDVLYYIFKNLFE